MVVVVAPSGRAYQPYLLAVFLALFFFFAVFLAALRFFAIDSTSFLKQILHACCTRCQRKFSRRGAKSRLRASVLRSVEDVAREEKGVAPHGGTDHAKLCESSADERTATVHGDDRSRFPPLFASLVVVLRSVPVELFDEGILRRRC